MTCHLSKASPPLNSTTLGLSLVGFGETLQIHSVILKHREGKRPQVWGALVQSASWLSQSV